MVPVIEIQELQFEFVDETTRTIPLFESFSFRLNDGELLTMLGPSGCGKTTLIRLIAGLLRPSGGRILFDGKQIDGPERARGVVFQEDTCYPWLTVERNIAFGLPPGHGGSELNALLDLVGLSAVRDYFPRQLSFGMRQRVALARAIAGGARVLLMDEPLSALDAFTRSVLQEDLSEILRRPGQAALWVTHDLDEALLLGDRIIVVAGRPLSVVREIQPQFETTDLRSRRLGTSFQALRDELQRTVMELWEPKEVYVKSTR